MNIEIRKINPSDNHRKDIIDGKDVRELQYVYSMEGEKL